MPRMKGLSVSFGGAHQMFEGNDQLLFFSLKSFKEHVSYSKYYDPARAIKCGTIWVENFDKLGLEAFTKLLQRAFLCWPPLINEYKTWTEEQKTHICEIRKDPNYAKNLAKLGEMYVHHITYLATQCSFDSDKTEVPKLKNKRQTNDIDVEIGYPFISFLSTFATHSAPPPKFVYGVKDNEINNEKTNPMDEKKEIKKSSLEQLTAFIKIICQYAPSEHPATIQYFPWDLFTHSINYICPGISIAQAQKIVIEFNNRNIAWSPDVDLLREEMNVEQPYLYGLFLVSCMVTRGCTSGKIAELCKNCNFQFPNGQSQLDSWFFFNLIQVFVTTKFLEQLNKVCKIAHEQGQMINRKTGLVNETKFSEFLPTFVQAMLAGKVTRNPNEWLTSFQIHDLAKGGLRFFKSTGNSMTTAIKALEFFGGNDLMLSNLSKIERHVASVYMEKARNFIQSADHISVHFDGTQLRKLPEIQCFIFQAVNLHLQQTSGPIAGYCQVRIFTTAQLSFGMSIINHFYLFLRSYFFFHFSKMNGLFKLNFRHCLNHEFGQISVPN